MTGSNGRSGAGDPVHDPDLHEQQRLAAVRRHAILDTPPDGSFDRITELAARIFSVPIAIVSIVDENRVWFKSHHGLDSSEVDGRPGLCASAVLQDEPYILADARRDPVALTHPLVAGEFGLRFYAAAPLRTSDGYNLGTLCVLDLEPRTLSATEVATLQDLAALVVDQLETRLAARAIVEWAMTSRGDALREQRRATELATALQTTLQPTHLPDIPGLEIAAAYHAADREEIGGDFYDLFPLPRGAWAITIGDVCGKGARAAAVSGAARYAVRAAAIDHHSPAQVLAVLNETLILSSAGDDPRFCTIAFARIRPHGQDAFQVTVASGGHPLPMILRADGHVASLGQHGTVVGLLPEVTIIDRSSRLGPGDAVVFFTDGITEASVDGRLYGEDGLAATLRGCDKLNAADIIEQLEQASLGAGGHQRDDAAIVVIKVAARG